jgi:hypothetical protein
MSIRLYLNCLFKSDRLIFQGTIGGALEMGVDTNVKMATLQEQLSAVKAGSVGGDSARGGGGSMMSGRGGGGGTASQQFDAMIQDSAR